MFVYIEYFMLNQLLEYLPTTHMKCIIKKILLQNTFIKNMAGTKNLMSNTAYRRSMGLTKKLYRQLYKLYSNLLRYLLLISKQINFNASHRTYSIRKIDSSLLINLISRYILSILCK